jgi:hypothetical protein
VLGHPDIRFHIKVVVLAILRSLVDPSAGEWQMLKPLMSADTPLARQIWLTVRTLPWFERLDEDHEIERLLESNDATVQTHALGAMLGAIKQQPDRMAQLIGPYAGTTDQYINWLAWVTRFADVRDSRPLFDLVLDAVRRGDYNGSDQVLWNSVYGLGQHQPSWAIELLHAWLAERPGAFDLDPTGHVSALQSSEYNLLEVVRESASGASALYCELLVPYLLRVMALTERNTGQRPIVDAHFSYRQQGPGQMSDLDDTLLHGAATALRRLVEEDPSAAQPILETLATDQHDSAQWLLYEALRSDGRRYADWTADLLLEGEYRFYSGYLSDLVWTTRQLLESTTPHMPEDRFSTLEAALLDLRPYWETRPHQGWTVFECLSVIPDDRLSGAARRRLGELRRRFQREQPAAPVNDSGGFVGPPIPETASQRMNDDQWLGAIRRYDTDETNFESMTGGAHELSQVMRSEAIRDPARFARLATRLTADMSPAYANAILEALGQTNEPVDESLVFDAIRHVAALGNAENDQALSMALQRQLDSDVPDYVIEIILNRALQAADQTADLWSQAASGGQPYYGGDIFNNGFSTARGHAAVVLGDLVVHDTDGHRTQLVAPFLSQLAQDSSVAVRSCVAHLLAACLRHASEEAVAAFDVLIQADDRLLATRQVIDLAIYVSMGKLEVIRPLVERMLSSSEASVRESGGLLAAFAGLEFGLSDLLTAARQADDPVIRKGAASLCARRLSLTSDATAAIAALQQFVADSDEEVRKAATQLAASLRDKELRPYVALLTDLISSESFREALVQLLITLQRAPDRIDDIVITCTQRFLDVFGAEAADISTSAAGHADQVTKLILRAYAQATSDWNLRSQTLDLIDRLLEVDALGATEAVDQAER